MMPSPDPREARFARVAPDIVDAYLGIGAATAHEAQGRTGALSATLKPLQRGMRLCGPAYPLRLAPGDNLGLHYAAAAAAVGDVLVIDAQDQLEHGPFGEILAIFAQVRGLAGLLTSGSVRDSAQIAALGLPVFCKGVSMKGTNKRVVPDVCSPIGIDGVTIRPGDLVLGDDDGVVVVPRETASAVLAKSLARVAAEAETIELVRAGKSPWELLGLDAVLQQLTKTS
jgi:4-hydroxy-4-methyl-2-oxoglutarate aldolase